MVNITPMRKMEYNCILRTIRFIKERIAFIFVAVVFSTDTKIEIVYAENSYTSTPVITVLTHGLGGHPAAIRDSAETLYRRSRY